MIELFYFQMLNFLSAECASGKGSEKKTPPHWEGGLEKVGYKKLND
jgi:hypothetical protein